MITHYAFAVGVIKILINFFFFNHYLAAAGTSSLWRLKSSLQRDFVLLQWLASVLAQLFLIPTVPTHFYVTDLLFPILIPQLHYNMHDMLNVIVKQEYGI